MHIPYLTAPHLAFVAFSVGHVFLLASAATLIRTVSQKLHYGIIITALWSLEISFSIAADYLEVSARTFGIASCCLAVLMLILLIARSRTYSPRAMLARIANTNDFSELRGVLLLWGVGYLILLLPLMTAVAPGAVIPGHFVCNDSVIHSIMAEGLKSMRALDIPSFYSSGNYRGLSSWMFYVNRLIFRVDIPLILLPATLFAYSLVIFPATYCCSLIIGPSRSRYLPSLLTVTPFLLGITSYLFFVGQVTLFPILLASVAILISPPTEKTSDLLICLIAFAVASLGVYSIFPFTIMAAAVAVWGFDRLILGKGFNELAKEGATLFSGIGCGFRPLLIVLLCLLTVPPAILTYGLMMRTDLSGSPGNLSGGYLSVFHLTGFWPPIADYRDPINAHLSHLQHLLLAVLLIQSFLVFYAGRSASVALRVFWLLQFAFFIPLELAALRPFGQYVHFKYFSYFIPVFQLAVGIGLIKLIGESGRFKSLSTSMACAYIVAMIVIPLNSYSELPAVFAKDFATLREMRDHYFSKYRVMILTREDWVQYYLSGNDDFAPLTQYLPQLYSGTELDYLVFDTKLPGDTAEYITRFSYLESLSKTTDPRCRFKLGQRYTVISARCVRKAAQESSFG